ncbi:hypothetical protein [Eggerthia catenaformis]
MKCTPKVRHKLIFGGVLQGCDTNIEGFSFVVATEKLKLTVFLVEY